MGETITINLKEKH